MSSNVISFMWSRPVVLFAAIMVSIPIWAPLLPPIDGYLFPVTSKVQFVDVQPVEGGSTLRMSYTKYRDCEFLGVTVDRNGVPIEFRLADGGKVGTVATGRRLSAVWFIGTTDLSELRLRWIHRCSPLYVTITTGYP